MNVSLRTLPLLAKERLGAFVVGLLDLGANVDLVLDRSRDRTSIGVTWSFNVLLWLNEHAEPGDDDVDPPDHAVVTSLSFDVARLADEENPFVEELGKAAMRIRDAKEGKVAR